MSEAGRFRGRPHDAQAAREAILEAAEAAFAEHGFAGARIDAIAEAAGYNKSLIFHYYDDKLGLYRAAIRRARDQADPTRAKLLVPLLSDTDVTADPHAFRAFLERVIKATFDSFVAHPRLLRILAWEEAEGWATMDRISAELGHGGLKSKIEIERFIAALERAERAGVLRPGISPRFVLYVMINICRTYITSLPLFQIIGLGEDVSTPDALAWARDQLAAFVVDGIVVDPSGDAVGREPLQAK